MTVAAPNRVVIDSPIFAVLSVVFSFRAQHRLRPTAGASMTEAELTQQGGGISGAAEASFFPTGAGVSSGIGAPVFMVGVAAGPPFAADVSPMLQALVRALLGVLVIAVVRLRPAAVAVAWGL